MVGMGKIFDEKTAICECGAEFTRKNSRRVHCEKCRRKRKVAQVAEAQRRQKERDPVAFNALRAKIGRDYRRNNPEQVRKTAREYKARNRERHREYQRRHRAERRDHYREVSRKWYHENHERSIAMKNKSRARMRTLKQAATNPDAWTIAKAAELQTCERLHLRALNLPCGSNEACIGCEKNTKTTESILNRGAWKEGYA